MTFFVYMIYLMCYFCICCLTDKPSVKRRWNCRGKNLFGRSGDRNVNELTGPGLLSYETLAFKREPSKTGHSGRYLCAATFRTKHSFAGSVPRGKRWVDRFLTRIAKSFIAMRPCCKKQYEKWVRLRPMILFLPCVT